MSEAWIIDTCRTPRGIGKKGKGSLADEHPQHLGATVLKALTDRNDFDTADVSDVIFGTSSQRGRQSGDLARMAALDAGYDIRASGVTLDRFCGSGITAVNLSAANLMAGVEDLVIAGGAEMMSTFGEEGTAMSPFLDNGNLRLRAVHPQPHQGGPGYRLLFSDGPLKIRGVEYVDEYGQVSRMVHVEHRLPAEGVEARTVAGTRVRVVGYHLDGVPADERFRCTHTQIAGHAGVGVHGEDRVEDRIADVIGDLVGVARRHGLGGEEVTIAHGISR